MIMEYVHRYSILRYKPETPDKTHIDIKILHIHMDITISVYIAYE